MKLFLKLNDMVSLPSEQKFVYAVLKRLSVTESLAASQFQPAKPLAPLIYPNFMDSIKDIIKKNQYTEDHTQAIMAIFHQSDVIAQLIADVCFREWRDKTLGNVKKIAKLSTIAVLHASQNHLIEDAMRTYLKTHTIKILDRLNKPELITGIDTIKTTLTGCFPMIDQKELNTAILSMMQAIQCLQRLEPIELAATSLYPSMLDNQEEWTQIEQPSGVEKLGIFGVQPASNAVRADAGFSCVIS